MVPKRNTRFRNIAATAIAAGKLAYRGARKVRTYLTRRPRRSFGTQTMAVVPFRKPRAKRAVVHGLGSGIASKSEFIIKRKHTKQTKAMKMVGAPNFTIYNGQSTLLAEAGFQNFGSIVWDDTDRLYGLIAAASPTTGSMINVQPSRFLLESTFGELLFTNSTNMACEVEIYDIVLKQDLPYYPTTRVGAQPGGSPATASGWDPTPQGAWVLGASLASGAQIAGTQANVIGSSPFDSQLFKDHFAVHKRTLVQMPLGSVHRHFVQKKHNRLVTQAHTYDEVIGAWRGITSYTMYVVRGYPVQLSGELGAGSTTASCQLNLVQSVRCKWTYVQDATAGAVYNDALQSPLEGEEFVINTSSGIVEQIKSVLLDHP